MYAAGAVAAVAGLAACNGSRVSEPAAPDAGAGTASGNLATATGSAKGGSGPRFVAAAADGDVASLVARGVASASSEHRLVVV